MTEEVNNESTVRRVDDQLTRNMENFVVLVSMEKDKRKAKKALHIILKEEFFKEPLNFNDFISLFISFHAVRTAYAASSTS